MPNAAFATLAGVGDFDPVLFSPDQSNRVASCLQALAAHPQAEQIFASANDLSAHDDYWPAADSWQSQLKPYVVKGGVLQIPVKGVLLHNFPYAVGAYATGYYYIQKALERGLADPDVKGVALVCDSPGGHVAGCFELADRIYQARSVKPIAAFAHEHAFSAAYAVASAAKKITVSRTGGVGSIGVVTMHMDYSKMLDNAGVKITFIFAGKHKVDGNAYEALSDDAKARIQTRIDEAYGVFCAAVARNRGLEEKQIRKTEALTFTASEAVDQKLADAIGPLDEAMAEFSQCLFGGQGDDNMTTQADKDAAEAAQRQAVADATAQGAQTGAAAERKRIADIKACDEAKDRPAAAESLAMNTSLSLAEAKAVLAGMPKEAAAVAPKTNDRDEGFAKVMGREGATAAGAGAEATDQSALTDEQKQDAEAVRLLDAKFGKGSTAALRQAS